MWSRRWLLVVALLLWPGWGWAANLTDAQYQLYHDDVTITHASEFATALANSDWQFITTAYNQVQSPTYWCWRTSLGEKEIYEATADGGGTWNWTTYKGQTVQERDSWARMMTPGTINPSLANTRAAFDTIFGGQGASATQRNYLLALSRRAARRIEALLIKAGSGDGSTTIPSTLGFEGTVSYQDTFHAIGGGPLP